MEGRGLSQPRHSTWQQ